MGKQTKKTQSKQSSKKHALDPSREWSLEEVEAHLPKFDVGQLARVRDALVRAHGDEGLVALGASFATEDILAAVPGFLVGTVLALEKVGSRVSGLAMALVPLLLTETRELDRVNNAFELETRSMGSEIAGRREKLKRTNSRALRERRAVGRTLLRSVLASDDPRRASLERAAAKAATPAATVASVRTVARILEDVRQTKAAADLLDDYGYSKEYVTKLNALADEVEALSKSGAAAMPPLLTNQRALDRQDGLVLAIVRAIWAPLREAAQETQGAIGLPPLGALERLVMNTSNGEDDDTPAPVEPSPPPTV